MTGRKQRGHGRRDPRRSRGRGRGPGYVERYHGDGDLAIDTTNFLSRDSRKTPMGRGSRLKNLDDPDNSRNQTLVQQTTSSRGNGFRYGRNWRVGHISPDPSRAELAPRHHPESKVHHSEVSLSQQLYEDRPLLRPIGFVPSMFPSLFLTKEEIFKPMAEEADGKEASHVPTSDRIFQIFHRSNLNSNSSGSPSGTELPEIDFMDLGRFISEMEGSDAKVASSKNDACTIEMAEGQTTAKTVEEPLMGEHIDFKLSPVQDSLIPANHIPVEHHDIRILGEEGEGDDNDEIIVYVAPNPRKGKLPTSTLSSSTTVVAIPPLADGEPVSRQVRQATNDFPSPIISPAELSLEHIHTPSGDVSNIALSGSFRSVRRVRRPLRVSSRRVKRHVTFGSLGAIRAEAALRKVDLQRDEHGRGDSDVDWGDSTSEGSLEDGGMLVDHDVDVYAMEAFVKGMSITGSAHVTADDLRNEARIRAEEEEEKGDDESAHESDGSTDQYDEESALSRETRVMLISDGDIAMEDDPVECEDEGTSEEEKSPRGSFQARLERLRKITQGRPIRDVLKDGLDGDLEVEEEGSIVAQIQDFLDDNDEILRAQDRKQRNRIFQAINHGKFEFEMDFADSPALREKNKTIPKELHEQWERDRAKKAERKHLRELERSTAGLDLYGSRKGSKKKKASKARLAAALSSPMSVETAVELMRRFVADTGGGRTRPLPPMSREMRKTVHDLAQAFNLNSKSNGSGAARYTTLTKTTLSGKGVNEKAIARILARSSSYVMHEGGKGKARPRAGKIRPRDGEVVGEAAPKLDGSNIGFQMLSSMGWEEGGRIGSVGGLEVPLVAVIKTTKLGLGASTSRY